MSYAIISVGGKQYRVREGERLLVDRVSLDDGATFTPAVLLVGGGGATSIAPDDVTVTAKVVAQAKGPKLRIGKYKKRTGYKRHTGFRASLTEIEIQSIGAGKVSAKPAKKEPAEPKAAEPKAAEPKAPKAAKAETPAPAGVPDGYAEMTVADIKQAAASWGRASVEAALAYETAHGNRKGAVAALEAALTEEEH
ncbi:MAG: 50S ribosomal protein L21 [Gaiellales bacterium]